MRYTRAISDMANDIQNVLHTAIKTIYPKYYPKEVVDFFCRHHSKEHILDGIASGNMGVLVYNDVIVGTGCFDGNHISKTYDTVILEASLPAACLYEHRGHQTVGHGIYELENDVKLVYEIMEKKLKEISMDYRIRQIRENEYDILSDFLYEAIFIPKGMEKPLKSIIEQPELQVYIADFGKADDWCLVAEVKEKIVGAVWVRIMNDYGHIDDETPSLSISLYEEYRHLGLGTVLMKEMLQFLKDKGYKRTSLSVHKANYAVTMYRKAGFEVVKENEEEYIMVCRLQKNRFEP